MEPVNSVGIIPYFVDPSTGAIRFLAVKNKWGDRNWGFPKGHIDASDGGVWLTTALRELKEETGIDSDCVVVQDASGPRGTYASLTYPMRRPTKRVPSGVKHAAFFLGRVEGQSIPEVSRSAEHQVVGWYPLTLLRIMLPKSYLPILEMLSNKRL